MSKRGATRLEDDHPLVTLAKSVWPMWMNIDVFVCSGLGGYVQFKCDDGTLLICPCTMDRAEAALRAMLDEPTAAPSGNCATVHRKLFPGYEALLAECCAKEARLIEVERSSPNAVLRQGVEKILEDDYDTCGGIGEEQLLIRLQALIDEAPAESESFPEVCICAAIRLPDDRIIRGHRHDDAMRYARELIDHLHSIGREPAPWSTGMERNQGFITSTNRYVGREEGLGLQLAAGISSACPSGYRARYLFSQDLY
jgi:hypothetical protein